jgi:Uma2 family endonuclease
MLDVRRIAPEQLRGLRRAEYEWLVEQGFFEDERLELLFGVLVSRSPQKAPHAGVVQVLTKLLVRACADRAEVRVQLPLAATEDSEPEPDLAVVPPGNPFSAHPESALLVVEVADSSLTMGRAVKSKIYAACGVLEYRVVNLADESVEVYTDIRGGEYRTIQIVRRGEAIALQSFPDVVLRLEDFLPR